MPFLIVKRIHVLFLLILLIPGVLSPQVRSVVTLPPHQAALVGEPLSFILSLPPQILRNVVLESSRPGILLWPASESVPVVKEPDEFYVNIKLFGVIPLRQVAVSAYPPVRVVSGGQAIGVLLRTQGVIVVGSAPVRPGRRGQPGEKVGIFYGDGELVGRIAHNTSCGIFGTLERGVQNPFYPQPIPVALVHQIRTGPAEMLTVLYGRKIEKFAVESVRVKSGVMSDSKNLVIRITDRRLLREAGGIVQGMSGSPIVQGGRLVGAVTHVFVNNPARGYGISAETMLRACGLLRPVDRLALERASVYSRGEIRSKAA